MAPAPDHNGRPMVHGLWIGGTLSPLERLTLASFRAQGYDFTLWAYEELAGVPPGTRVRNAAEIVAREQVFSYRYANKYGHGKGSYAGFSDIFRYRLLFLYGGTWVDMDVTCLRPLPEAGEYLFRHHHQFGVVGNVMRCPPGAPVMDWCYKQASERMDASNKRWELPIEILRAGIARYGLENAIMPLGHRDSWPEVAPLVARPCNVPDTWYIVHWMNEEWRRLGLPKDKVLPGSCLAGLLNHYGVEARDLEGLEALRAKWRMGRPNYIWQSLKGRMLAKAIVHSL